MFTADRLRKIKPTSSYQSRLEKSVKQGIKSNKRFIKRRLIKAQKRDEKSYQFTVEVPDEFKTDAYYDLKHSLERFNYVKKSAINDKQYFDSLEQL